MQYFYVIISLEQLPIRNSIRHYILVGKIQLLDDGTFFLPHGPSSEYKQFLVEYAIKTRQQSRVHKSCTNLCAYHSSSTKPPKNSINPRT